MYSSISALAISRVLSMRFLIRSFFKLLKNDSATALSQQLPRWLRGGSGWLDSLGHLLSGAWRVADYAAVSRVVRLSAYILVRCLAVKCLMRPGLIVERQISRYALMRRPDGLMGAPIYLLVFEASP